MVDSKKMIFLAAVPHYTQIKKLLRLRILDGTNRPHEQMRAH
ncbi:MAG TPA: hypothetical protein VMV87_20210 [Burkholderiales bacterium]|nr:hypothetical protein [Burkholderiales bacterium]